MPRRYLTSAVLGPSTPSGGASSAVASVLPVHTPQTDVSAPLPGGAKNLLTAPVSALPELCNSRYEQGKRL
jgi:hypothetical protein